MLACLELQDGLAVLAGEELHIGRPLVQLTHYNTHKQDEAHIVAKL